MMNPKRSGLVRPPTPVCVTEAQHAVFQEKACDDLGGGGQEHADSLATKMKRQKLWEMFPTVDRPTLEEVYKASG